MLVDAVVRTGKMHLMVHYVALMAVLYLMMCSQLSAWACLVFTIICAAMDYWWLKHIILARCIQQLWQGDHKSWYWQQRGASARLKGELKHIRNYGVGIYLRLQAKQKTYHVFIWKDQVNAEEWRKLMVQARLNQIV